MAYVSFPEKILKIWCFLVRFGVYLDQIVSWKIPQKLTYIYIKKKIIVTLYTLYLALGENML